MGLDRTRALLDEAGAPDRGLRGVLVAGTNGKGSTCAFISAVLHHAGLAAAAMPKPHLVSYTERVTVDGEPIGEADFAAAVTAMVPAIDRVSLGHGAPTEFEILTAVALRHARDRGVDLLVCEVGMGGRLDATNVTDLGVKVLTSIDLDHMQYLGDTLPEIAAEKAAIIRRGDLVVCGRVVPEALEVIEARCRREGAELWLAGREFDATVTASGWDGIRFDFAAAPGSQLHSLAGLRSKMIGRHQLANACLAIASVQAMVRRHGIDVDDQAIQQGIAAARWPGRLECIPGSPTLLIDGGHNPAAVRAVVATVLELAPTGPTVLVFGAMQDKDTGAMLELLPPGWPVVFTAVDDERAAPAAQLLEVARRLGRAKDVERSDVGEALAEAAKLAGAEGLVVVLGSLYLAGDVRRRLAPGDSSPIFGR
ncbi:MAG: bifunctional folylpolyglutamate synthase/dihydrofolate synthase [Candidatus Dormibacteria bacterium]